MCKAACSMSVCKPACSGAHVQGCMFHVCVQACMFRGSCAQGMQSMTQGGLQVGWEHTDFRYETACSAKLSAASYH